MTKIEKLTESFQFKFERFLIGCDALEEQNDWNREKYGEMDVFYQNDLLSVILRLVAADNQLQDKETLYVNKAFGFDYTTEELAEIYANCVENITEDFAEQLEIGLSLMRSINEKLAEAYRDLLELVCEIIIASDDVIAPEEIAAANQLKELLS